MCFLFYPGKTAKYLAMGTFVLACLTDFLDGYIARKRKLENDFGRLMDPIADKILILAAFLGFNNLFRNIYLHFFYWDLEIFPAWMVIIIIFRELVITGLRLNLARQGKIMVASLEGKHKTVYQMTTIILILLFLIIQESAVGWWNATWEIWFRRSIFYLMLITVIFTLSSGISYLVKSKDTLFSIHE